MKATSSFNRRELVTTSKHRPSLILVRARPYSEARNGCVSFVLRYYLWLNLDPSSGFGDVMSDATIAAIRLGGIAALNMVV